MCLPCWTGWGNERAMTQTILFDPLVPWPCSRSGLPARLTAGRLLLALWRGLSGWALRALAALVMLAALAGPVLPERRPRAAERHRSDVDG